ncbi:hypothetical protein ACFL0Z_01145 [Patescibacteria group bacterium]
MADPKNDTPDKAGDDESKYIKESMGSEADVHTGQSTQQYLDIEEIKDGVLVLRDGSLRMVAMAESLNFALKSAEEQEAIIYAYQSFLNSVEFPVQIVVQSRRLDITPYLDMLKERESEQTTELLKIQTAEYIDFISQLIELRQIMSKDFYIVVPLFPFEKKKNGFLSSFFQPAAVVMQKESDFHRYRDQLIQRIEHAATGLQGVGIKIKELGTQDLIALMYNTYNPATFQQESLEDITKLDVSTGDFVVEDKEKPV